MEKKEKEKEKEKKKKEKKKKEKKRMNAWNFEPGFLEVELEEGGRRRSKRPENVGRERAVGSLERSWLSFNDLVKNDLTGLTDLSQHRHPGLQHSRGGRRDRAREGEININKIKR
ncbi:hypothetical protein D8B26_004783 [Coccidioides posadasii str. Silveira]|uniref:uncharacterized protein n=1 Tax=Coccidioides posadasii (strain RMSCC 757 / Silveira) TaxID=443226 RepID=UPI001BF004C7|nr:hypothetical protein D8B26_004783 [Coccidioides posadasii str. Silveira]